MIRRQLNAPRANSREPRAHTPHRFVALLAVSAALTLSACGHTSTPPEQDERLLKAAGVAKFRITCTKDIWEKTKPIDGLDNVTVLKRDGKVYTFELTGPELVTYLDYLDRNAHGGWDGAHEPESIRMYNAIAPVVDRISATPEAGSSIAEVSLQDALAAPSATG